MLPSPQRPSLSGGAMFLPAQPQASAACTSICCTCGVAMPPNAARPTRARAARAAARRHHGGCTAPRRRGVLPGVLLLPPAPAVLAPRRPGVARAHADPPPPRAPPDRPPRRRDRRRGVRLHGAPLQAPQAPPPRRREVLHGVTMEQDHVVEFTVHDRLCDACGRAQADPDQWSAVVQVRQRASHRRTLLHLEQQLVRHGAAASALRVDGNAGGLDLYFASRSHAARLVDFVSSVAPARVGTAKQLVSHDTKSNSYNFKHTFSLELCPICRDDLIFLPGEASRALGGLGPLVLCIKVASSLALLDTNTMRVVVLGIKEYDRYKFEPLLTSRRLVEYVVLDVERDTSGDVTAPGSPFMMSWAHVARASDLGKNDTVFTVKTHLGGQLKHGDYALGTTSTASTPTTTTWRGMGRATRYLMRCLPRRAARRAHQVVSRRTAASETAAFTWKRLPWGLDALT
ncbi:hypothetical protein PVAP13_5KG769200 [Panicum virgatum]|uniref:60S ribosomal export protein NMD3 n=1 Tax=Panicum virgatum TaxID=38727 RepID=A0A8T0T186_PANVG|nr:hypothetical protein PVAP13_5KG769200 [Panicum virgatum]